MLLLGKRRVVLLLSSCSTGECRNTLLVKRGERQYRDTSPWRYRDTYIKPGKRSVETVLGWVTESRIAKTLRRLVVESRKGDPRTARTDKAVSYWVGGGGRRPVLGVVGGGGGSNVHE